MLTNTLLIGLLLICLCVAIQALISTAIVKYISFIINRKTIPNYFVIFLRIQTTALLLVISFLLQIALWSFVYIWTGELKEFHTAFYFSAVNYATLGYGDIILSNNWRLLGAMEAVNGLLMGGFAASVFFSITFRLYEAQKQSHQTDFSKE